MERHGRLTLMRGADRYRTDADGITSWHCFSAGPHYAPDNVSFGPLVGVDEHLVEPGAGFDWHAHRGVEIVSFVLDGILRHQSEVGERLVPAGEVLRQDATGGLRHRETNGGDGPLRFVQTTWLAGTGTSFDVLHGPARLTAPRTHLYVARGAFAVAGTELAEGDSVRTDEPVDVSGDGDLLVVVLTD